MNIEKALQILYIVKCDCFGYCRSLAYTPTHKEVGEAIEVLEREIEKRKQNEGKQY